MRTGRPKGPEKILYRKRVTEEMARKLDCVASGECAEPVMPESVVEHNNSEDRVKRLQEENKRLDQSLSARESEAIEMRAEMVRLKASVEAEKNPSVFAVENIGLKKRIGELELKVRSFENERLKESLGIKGKISGEATGIDQVAMWKACADDFEGKLKKAEYDLRKLQKWYETTDVDAKCKKGWQMYYMLKEGKKGSEFDQEVSS